MKTTDSWWASLSFGGRLLVTTSVALLLAGTVMLVGSARQEATEIQADLRTELEHGLKTLPAMLAETVVVGDFSALQQSLDSVVVNPSIYSVVFQDHVGTRLSSNQVSTAAQAPAWFVELFKFTNIDGNVPVVVGGRKYGQIHLQMTSRHLAGRAWSHLSSQLQILLLALTLDFIGIWLVLRQGLRPLAQLEAGAQALASGNLNLRLTPEGSPELRRVIDAFNHMAEAICAAQATLNQEQQRLANIIEGTHVGTWEWNVQTGAAIFNPRWAEIVGYTLEELAPVSIDTWVKLVHPDDMKLSGALLEKHFIGDLPYYDCEARMRHKAGHWVWVHDQGRVASRTPDGKPLLVSGTHQDISTRKANESLLRDVRHQAVAANLAKSRFLATMSHEIRTPMNGILGMAQMLLHPNLHESERADYARTILSSGQTLLKLLNDILDISKIEAGKFQLESTAFSPKTLMHETCNLFASAALAKGVQLDYHWQGPAAQRYLADSHRLRQMLANLIGNAIKFTARGSIHMRCEQTQREDQTAWLEFSVQDSGIGIAADKIELLFKPFSQADSSTTREFGGSGLGLSIVRQLARAMGGDVGVNSETGIGSTFSFRIQTRIVTDQQDSRSTARTGPEQPHPEANNNPLQGHLLVAEDNPVNALVIKSLLSTLGLTMTLAVDGQQAVAAIIQGEAGKLPDLILMDLNMPVLDGYGATEKIRQWEADNAKPRLPIIALTADAFEEDRQHCLAVGMDDFLTKPIALGALRSALARWLPSEAQTFFSGF